MKKHILPILLLLTLTLSLTLLCGCSGSNENTAKEETAPAQEEIQTETQETPFFIGNWFARTAVANGNTVDAKDVFGGTFVLIFKEDGKCIMAIDNQQASLDWSYNDDGTITLTGDTTTYSISFPDGSEDTMIAVIKGVEVTMEKTDE